MHTYECLTLKVKHLKLNKIVTFRAAVKPPFCRKGKTPSNELVRLCPKEKHPKNLTFWIQLGFSFLFCKVAGGGKDRLWSPPRYHPALCIWDEERQGRGSGSREPPIWSPSSQGSPYDPGSTCLDFPQGSWCGNYSFWKEIFKVDFTQTRQIINFSSSHKIETVAGSKPRTPGLWALIELTRFSILVKDHSKP